MIYRMSSMYPFAIARLLTLSAQLGLLAGFGLGVALGQTSEDFFEQAGARVRNSEERYEAYWSPHIKRSHRRILAAAKLAGKRSTAIVLGAGKCREIPLEQLAEQFQQVILVDLDGNSMREAVSLLPPPLRSRLQIRVADVTSFAKPLMEQMRDAVETSRTAEEAFHRLETVYVEAPDIQRPPELPRAGLVISSLLLSELHWYPHRYADGLLQDKFGVRLTDWSGHVRARKQLERLALADHVSLLEKFCHPDGVIYFADTIAGGPLHEEIDVNERRRVFAELTLELSRHDLFRKVLVEESVRDIFLSEFRAVRKQSRAAPLEREAVQSLLDRLGSWPASVPPDQSAAAAEAIAAMLCRGHFPIHAEVAILERLMDEYERVDPTTLEPQLALNSLDEGWRRNGLATIGQPEDWWWLEYPCAIPRTWGAFKVRSWILQKSL